MHELLGTILGLFHVLFEAQYNHNVAFDKQLT